jgi:hypothetical protein
MSSFLIADAALAAHTHRTGWHSHKSYHAMRTEDDPLYMDYRHDTRTEDDPLYMGYRHDTRTEDDPLYMEDYQPPEDFYRASPSGWGYGYEDPAYPPWDYPYDPRSMPYAPQPRNTMPY